MIVLCAAELVSVAEVKVGSVVCNSVELKVFVVGPDSWAVEVVVAALVVSC